jgi:hypothetical protein
MVVKKTRHTIPGNYRSINPTGRAKKEFQLQDKTIWRTTHMSLNESSFNILSKHVHFDDHASHKKWSEWSSEKLLTKYMLKVN